MKFSIVVPIYNAKESLDRCIESVNEQTFSDWELILVNDGSQDESGMIAEKYAEQDRRIRVLHKENEGQLLARRTGLRNACGEYVLFLDSDDYWEVDCLEIINEAVAKYCPDILMFPCRIVGAASKEEKIIGLCGTKRRWIDKRILYKEIISSHTYNSMCLKVFKRELLQGDKNDYSAWKGACYGEDKVQTLQPVTDAEKILFIPDILYNYVYNQQSTVHKINFEKIPCMISKEMFELTYRYMKQWGMDSKDSRECIAAYYLRNVSAVYYGIRKQCYRKKEMEAFHMIPWKNYIDKKAFRYVLSKKLSIKEKIKLFWIERLLR